MRKILVVAIIVLTQNVCMHGQYFKGGLSLGITGSQIDGDHYAGYTKPGASAGFFVSREFGRNWGIQGEFKYIMKGAAKTVTSTNTEVYRVTLHYFELPFTVYFNLNQKVRFEAGLASGYLIYSTINFGYGAETPSFPFNKYDFSPLIGIYYLLNEKFTVNLKFSYSAIPVRDYPGDPLYYRNSGQFNNVLNFAIYYSIK